jgi:voltage-gated sodium channel
VLNINLIFTVVFALELAVNMFANWMYTFIQSGWNWLDLFIVTMSLLDFGPFNNPLWLVRLMRAFRVVRLFGRVKELTKMISAITASLFPMMNAFVILIIVLSICEY